MGHYDDCYAADDFEKMSASEKSSWIRRFEKAIKEKGSTHATFDDVGGWILREWADSHPEMKVIIGHRDLEVLTKEVHDKRCQDQQAANKRAADREKEYWRTITPEIALDYLEEELKADFGYLSGKAEKILIYLRKAISNEKAKKA